MVALSDMIPGTYSGARTTVRTLRRGHGLSSPSSDYVTHRHHPSGLAAGKTGSAAGLFDSQGVSLVNLGQGFAKLRQKAF